MAQQRRGGFKRRKKVDFIAANKIENVDYKDTELLKRFISERGKILPRRVTGTSAKNQRKVVTAIKRARIMAMGKQPFFILSVLYYSSSSRSALWNTSETSSSSSSFSNIVLNCVSLSAAIDDKVCGTIVTSASART